MLRLLIVLILASYSAYGSHVGTIVPDRAVTSDSSGNLKSSSITSTEIGYLSGASSNIQSQINSLIGITALAPGHAVVSVTANYTIPTPTTDVYVYADTSLQAITVTLSDATLTQKYDESIKNIGNPVHDLIILPVGGQKIDEQTYDFLNTPDESVRYSAHGSNWGIF